MIAEANSIFLQAIAFSKANPIVASAAGLWGLSFIALVCRDIPARIWDFITYQSTTTLDLNSQDEIFFQFLDWVSANKLHRFVRTLNLHNGQRSTRDYDHEHSQEPKRLAIGYGRTFFFHGGRLFFVKRFKDSSNQTAKVKETLTLSVVGRNQKVFGELFETVIKSNDKEHLYTKIYTYNEFWSCAASNYKRHPSTVAIDPEVEKKLYAVIDNFIANKDWYAKNGVPYRLGILFQGPPGTGKTSLIKAICAKYSRNLYYISLNGLSDKSFVEALSEAPQGALIAIEDIDSQGVRVQRADEEDTTGLARSPLTIAGILNALDGAVSSEDRILIATTNHPEKLDPALVRPGRIDLILTIGNMEMPAFTSYMSRMYPNFVLPEGFKIRDGISPAEVQRLVFENKENYQPVLEALK